MAVYTPDFKKTPLVNLLGLINTDNNKGYGVADVDLRNLKAITPDVDGRNTSVEIDLLIEPSEVVGDFVEFKYERMGLSAVFAEIVAAAKHNIREIEAIDTDGQLMVTEFISELSRKYGFAITVADYDISMPTASQVKVVAKASNVAYIGEVIFTVDAALRTRLLDKSLAGFTKENIEPAA